MGLDFFEDIHVPDYALQVGAPACRAAHMSNIGIDPLGITSS